MSISQSVMAQKKKLGPKKRTPACMSAAARRYYACKQALSAQGKTGQVRHGTPPQPLDGPAPNRQGTSPFGHSMASPHGEIGPSSLVHGAAGPRTRRRGERARNAPEREVDPS